MTVMTGMQVRRWKGPDLSLGVRRRRTRSGLLTLDRVPRRVLLHSPMSNRSLHSSPRSDWPVPDRLNARLDRSGLDARTVEIRGVREPTLPMLRLMLALLDDAIHIIVKGAMNTSAASDALFIETVNWLHSEDASWLLSFLNVCDVLEIDPRIVRERLAADLTVHRACDAPRGRK
jgi:hypothetical protein